MEARVRHSEERYRAFLEHSSEAIWRIELEKPLDLELDFERLLEHVRRYAYLAECNDAMARMYGYERAEELVGVPLERLLPLDDRRTSTTCATSSPPASA